ncbi:hypothetical protein ACFXGT_04215 [Streptomyces sp. NPDC059352]|uniref:hypothetical protein n=1 Tax=Streptomyces sp. NPDC059352 TaxID=3346810 RepID=UPI0036788118
MAETDIPTLIADLKITVVQGHIRQILEHSSVMRALGDLATVPGTLAFLKEKIEDIHKEVVKAPITEWLEAAGLDGIAAGVEKIAEGTDWKTYLPYFAFAIGGFLLPLLGIMFLANFKEWQRNTQQWIARVILRRGDNPNIIAMSDNGRRPDILPRGHVEGREGAAGQAILTNPPAASTFDELKQALGQINRRIINFNKAVAKMKSAAALKKLAGGVEAVTKATDAANPTEIETLAKAIDKLGDAQDKFDPKKLPKARGLASAATEAERLAKAGDAVKLAFDNLKAAAQAAERVIAAS